MTLHTNLGELGAFVIGRLTGCRGLLDRRRRQAGKVRRDIPNVSFRKTRYQVLQCGVVPAVVPVRIHRLDQVVRGLSSQVGDVFPLPGTVHAVTARTLGFDDCATRLGVEGRLLGLRLLGTAAHEERCDNGICQVFHFVPSPHTGMVQAQIFPGPIG